LLGGCTSHTSRHFSWSVCPPYSGRSIFMFLSAMPARVACHRSANVFVESSQDVSNFIVKASAQLLGDQTIMHANLCTLWSALANVRAKYPDQDACFLFGQMVAWRAKAKRCSGSGRAESHISVRRRRRRYEHRATARPVNTNHPFK